MTFAAIARGQSVFVDANVFLHYTFELGFKDVHNPIDVFIVI